MTAANGLNRKVRTTDAGFNWHKPSVQIPAANGLNNHCTCRLQMTCAGAADAGCKWPVPGLQMPVANGLSRGCRCWLQTA